MRNRKVYGEHGFTLIELLAVLAIATIVFSLAFSVLFTVIRYNDKNQSQMGLEQEANAIINDIKNRHRDMEAYQICYEQLLLRENITMQLSLNDKTINKKEMCISNISPKEDLFVQLFLQDSNQEMFELQTTISGRDSDSIVLERNIENQDFYQFLRGKNVFIYGSQFNFEGSQVNGPNASIIVRGNLDQNQMNGGALNNTSNIYIDGSVNLDKGSAGLGSEQSPGRIVVNGDLTLWNGRREIFGDVYVNGNFKLKDAVINGNVYVNGDVELGWTPTINGNSKIYYTGKLTHPSSYQETILNNVVYKDSVPTDSVPEYPIPPIKEDTWFTTNGYSQTLTGNQNVKLFDDTINIDSAYYPNVGKYVDSFTNLIVVSKGDIVIGGNSWINKFTGILFAPNGKVVFNGSTFEGVVIARDGFHVKSGGTTLEFNHIDDYIKKVEEFPLAP
jgi:prepilin-type N-terminal cleavage/methylation domain-containing protein